MKIIIQKTFTNLVLIGVSFFVLTAVPATAQWYDEDTSGYQYNYSSYTNPNIDTVYSSGYSNTSSGWVDENPSTYQYNYSSYTNPNIDTVYSSGVSSGYSNTSSSWSDESPSTYQYNYGSYTNPNIDTVYSTGVSSGWVDENPSTYQYNYSSYTNPNIDTVVTSCNGCSTGSSLPTGSWTNSPTVSTLPTGGWTNSGTAVTGGWTNAPIYSTTPYASQTYTATPIYSSTPITSTYTTPVTTTLVCPTGSILSNGHCVSTVTGTVVTNIICPTGSALLNGQCINNITGTVVTTVNCPTGTVKSGNTCINSINGTVVTNINCPTGTVLTNGQCVNNVNGTVVTNTVCPTGTTLTNGQCVNTITPPVTTVTNCPSNTQYVNGTCRQIINPPVVTYQTCWDGAVIPATSVCAAQYKVCANGASIPVNQTCYVAPTPVYVPPTVVKFNNVVTSPVTQITNNSGRCNGIGLIANNAASTGWFEYGETANLGRTTASASIGSANTAPFSNVLANLKPSTKYYCRAVMQNQYGLVKGEIVGFTTKAKVTTYVKPVVVKPVTTTKPPVKNEVICSDGTTVTVKNQSSATLINQGQKLINLAIEKVDGNLSSEGTVHYKVTYKNITDTRLSGVVIKVTLPVEIKLVNTSTGNYDENTRTLTISQDGIDPYTEGTIVMTGTVIKDAPIGKTIVTNVYAVYTVPGTQTQDEVTAYVVGSIVPVANISNVDTGAKNVVGTSTAKSFMPNSLIEWLALIAILFIIFILVRSIYASYKEDDNHNKH